MYDIVIVGAGTAGLSAAIYACRAGKSVLLLEEKSYGGQIINTPEVENYPGIKRISGFEFATNLYQQAADLGAEIKYERAEGIRSENENKIVVTPDNEYVCRSVILATGAKNRPLGIENEAEMTGRGISYCATCDGAFFRNKDVAVIGGGNTALEDALFLSNTARMVYVIHRRKEFRGEAKRLEALRQKENVVFLLESTVVKLNGETSLESVEVENVNTKERRTLAISGLFVAIGQMPENRAFADLVDTDEVGYIVAAENCRTNEEGVFTAGDCRTKSVRQLATAAADGAIAGLAACEYIG
ncbi:MAG: thioredoxin-disulfide reductase [Eubacteriales bacterium]|nr:thioredoxin-disulfide reductase [Eubacteriales bacterium]